MTGDIAVVGLNANNNSCGGTGGDDFVSFVCFKDITNGTTLDITDNGYERSFPGLWGDTEGTYRATRTGGTISAGTVITWKTGSFLSIYPDTNWTFNSINGGWNSFNMNSGGDQLFFMQNGVWSGYLDTINNNASYLGGSILFGFNTKTTWAADGTTQQSNLPPNMDCFNMSPTGGASDFIKYTGPITPTTQKAWIIRISTQANWTKYANCTLYNSALPNYSAGVTFGITEFFNVDAGLNDTVCQNQAAFALGGTPSGGYWTGIGITDTTAGLFDPSTSGAGNFYVTYIYNDAGCPYHDVKMVVVRPKPTVTINPAPAEACVGVNFNITGSAAGGTAPYTQLWTGNTGYINNTSILNPVFNSSSTGSYNLILTVTDNKGCIGTNSLPINVNPNPTATITPDTLKICPDISGTITATPSGGSSTYSTHLWSGNTSIVSGSLNLPNITVNYGAAGSYNLTYTVTDSKGCKGSCSVPVIIKPNPVLTFTPASQAICSGDTSNIGLNSNLSGATFAWTVAQSAGVSGALAGSGTTIAQTLINSGTTAGTAVYTVTPTANSCNGTAGNVTVTVNPLPAAYNVTGGGVMCAGNTGLPIILSNSQTGINYQLLLNGNPVGSPIPGIGSLLTWPLQTLAGAYTIQATNTSCQQTMTGSASIAVNPAPAANAGQDTTIPYGTSATLSGSAAGGSGSYTYSWSPSSSLVNAALQNPATVALSNTVVFILTVTDNVTGCQGTSTVTVFVSGSILSVSSSATPNTVCAGNTVQLSAVPSGGSGNYSYSWSSNPPGFSSSVSNPAVSSTVTTTYTVTVSDGSNTATSSSVVTVNSIPVANAGQDTTICKGTTVTVSASSSTGQGALTYSWSNGSVNSSLTVTPDVITTYYVTVTDSHQCTDSDSVTVNLLLQPDFTITSTSTSCDGNNDGSATLVLITAGNPPYTYNWSSGDTGKTSINLVGGTYTVTVTDPFHCTNVKSIDVKNNSEITCLEIPSAYTPNKDGNNDTWEIKHINLYPKVIIEIYSRWGTLVFTSEGYHDPWDGTYNGNDAATGSYIYIINLNNGSAPINGIVTLIR
ncbi:MAG: gliding motility-associated C-terminal domain-containing protein [Bacteroidia bacterium]|nr:gliding motility-associated C-terminal domain-containing protein [Bacteroidia bacterium]